MGGYYSKALKKHLQITTVGPSFEGLKSDYDLKPGENLQQVLSQMTSPPDLIMCFYSKPDLFPPDLWEIPLPKAWYVYDTHLHFEELSATAYLFDLVICSDEPTREKMSAHGHAFTRSLGFAADVQFYYRKPHPNRPRKYQVGFAGSVYGHPQLQGRQALLERIQKKFDCRIEHRTLVGAAVADFFQDCQVVINHALMDDLNMRVPETLLSGRPLLTPMVTGLELQYQPNEHLIVFNETDVESKLTEMLSHTEQTEAMALRGQKWALEHHTYDVRAQQLIEHLNELLTMSKNHQLASKNLTLKKFAQFNYHRFRYPGDALTWLLNHWQPKNAPEKALSILLKCFVKFLSLYGKYLKKSYFQNQSRD